MGFHVYLQNENFIITSTSTYSLNNYAFNVCVCVYVFDYMHRYGLNVIQLAETKTKTKRNCHNNTCVCYSKKLHQFSASIFIHICLLLFYDFISNFIAVIYLYLPLLLIWLYYRCSPNQLWHDVNVMWRKQRAEKRAIHLNKKNYYRKLCIQK